MSTAEIKVAHIEDIPPSEQLIGVDSLLAEDPAARAAYSGAPGFIEGADAAHPIASAKDSILARPEIAEALEAVYRSEASGEQAVDLEGMNPDVALCGLKWLRKNLGDDSTVRREAIIARDIVTVEQKHIAREEQMSQARAENLSELHAAEISQRTQKERRLVHQKRRGEQFAHLADNVPEGFEDINLTSLLELADQLHSREDADGTITVEESRTFSEAIEKRVQTLLDYPDQLMNDFNALVSIQVAARVEPDKQLDIVFAYGEKIETSLLERLRGKAYTDFTPATMDEWFAAIDSQPDDKPIYEGTSVNRRFVAQEVLSKVGVLVNTLYLTATKNPFEFIDQLHTFARKGLEDGEPYKAAFTKHTIGSCLEQPLTGITLNQGATQAEAGSMTQQQAMDLCTTLDGFGVARHVNRGELSVDELSAEQAELVRALYPINTFASTSMHSTIGNLEFYRAYHDNKDSLTKEFKKKALSGEIDTMYANIVKRDGLVLRRRPEA